MLKPALEIASESFHLYLKNFRKLLPYLTVYFLPNLILAIIGIVSLYLTAYYKSPKIDIASNLIILALSALNIVITVWVSISIIKALRSQLIGQPLNWKDNLKNSTTLILPFISTLILVRLLTLLGSLLLIIPGIIFAVWYYFATYAVIFDDVEGAKSLRLSKSLVVGRWMEIAWRLLIFILVFATVKIIPIILIFLGLAKLPIPRFLMLTLGSLLITLIDILTKPLLMSAGVILYFNAKENPVEPTLPISPPKI